jgi:hypothetical protein
VCGRPVGFAVFGIADVATGVIVAGQAVAGSLLATVDLMALANVVVKSWSQA